MGVEVARDPNAPFAPEQLPPELSTAEHTPSENTLSRDMIAVSLREAREMFERDYLLSQIKRFGGNISKTAQFVGMERSALHRKLKSLGVPGQERGERGANE